MYGAGFTVDDIKGGKPAIEIAAAATSAEQKGHMQDMPGFCVISRPGASKDQGIARRPSPRKARPPLNHLKTASVEGVAMKTHAHHPDTVVGFGLLILTGAAVLAAFSGVALAGYLIGVVQTLVAAAVVNAGSDFFD
jgi:hypothetical protein